MSISLALKYRPQDFSDLTEQGSIKSILTEQIKTKTHKNAYLFTGGAGTGKTTSARILANKLNNGKGRPIEMDAASNNGVDDVRNIIELSKNRPIDSEYKVFIIDECHMLSTGAWNAMLKLLEEPPVQAIFVLCTTDPQKIPATILSRVQRYDFQRISFDGIVARLEYIVRNEANDTNEKIHVDKDALEYIAKLAEGGMRDAITLLDKSLSFEPHLTIDKVVEALGTVNYQVMFDLTNSLLGNEYEATIETIENVHRDGVDLKQFIKQYMYFLVDVLKYQLAENYDYLQLPSTYVIDYTDEEYGQIRSLLKTVVDLHATIKWEQNPKSLIEATFFLF